MNSYAAFPRTTAQATAASAGTIFLVPTLRTTHNDVSCFRERLTLPGKGMNAESEAWGFAPSLNCLKGADNIHLSQEDTREKVEVWRQDYNRHRPHGALDNPSPDEFTKVRQLVG